VLAKLGVEPGVRWHLGDAVVDPRVNDAGAVLAGDLAASARPAVKWEHNRNLRNRPLAPAKNRGRV
jgi:hypothetical protein